MPYPNFHAARIRDPNDFDHIVVLKTLSNGIMIYGGPLKSDPEGPTKTQAYRFPKDKFTVKEAKKWLKDRGIKYILFEPASEGKSFNYDNMEFESKEEFQEFMVQNKDKLITQKKAIKKEIDCSIIISPILVFDPKLSTNKANNSITDPANLDTLKVVCIINTTNFLDSHMDVHLPGLWNKSLQDNKNIMHLQEHNMQFDKIIADGDDLKVYTKIFKWSELGYDYEGETEALVFESVIRRDRNEYMLNQYAKKWVRNHSVGMYYVKLAFALDNEDYPNEYEAWQKYYPEIANPEMADEKGFFWYVLEAKCIEGSAVPIGSNTATPTLEGTKNEPSQGTHNTSEPSDDTQEIDYKYLLTNLKN